MNRRAGYIDNTRNPYQNDDSRSKARQKADGIIYVLSKRIGYNCEMEEIIEAFKYIENDFSVWCSIAFVDRFANENIKYFCQKVLDIFSDSNCDTDMGISVFVDFIFYSLIEATEKRNRILQIFAQICDRKGIKVSFNSTEASFAEGVFYEKLCAVRSAGKSKDSDDNRKIVFSFSRKQFIAVLSVTAAILFAFLVFAGIVSYKLNSLNGNNSEHNIEQFSTADEIKKEPTTAQLTTAQPTTEAETTQPETADENTDTSDDLDNQYQSTDDNLSLYNDNPEMNEW